MTKLSLEEVVEIDAPKRGTYRQTIIDFLESDMRNAKIVCEFPRRAKSVRDGLRSWIRRGEPVRIRQDGYVVYLIRTDVEGEQK